MADEDDVLTKCKIGLGLSTEANEAIDGLITQKIATVKALLIQGGVAEEKLTTQSAIGVITMGVTDIWEVRAGEAHFSPAFIMLATQLAMG